MERQPQNPEFRNNPENCHPWINSNKFLYNKKNPFRRVFLIKRTLALEVKRFTENAVHRGAFGSVRFTIRSSFIFGSVRSIRFIRSF